MVRTQEIRLSKSENHRLRLRSVYEDGLFEGALERPLAAHFWYARSPARNRPEIRERVKVRFWLQKSPTPFEIALKPAVAEIRILTSLAIQGNRSRLGPY
jgi:hypothetical protein